MELDMKVSTIYEVLPTSENTRDSPLLIIIMYRPTNFTSSLLYKLGFSGPTKRD